MALRFANSFRSIYTNSVNLVRNKNAIGGQNLVEGIYIGKSGQFIAAWHPDVEFPYECSKPIPATSDVQSSAVIKETALQAANNAFKNKHPEVARQELMRLTHTTKHRWFPRSRDKRAKKTAMDRPFL